MLSIAAAADAGRSVPSTPSEARPLRLRAAAGVAQRGPEGGQAAPGLAVLRGPALHKDEVLVTGDLHDLAASHDQGALTATPNKVDVEGERHVGAARGLEGMIPRYDEEGKVAEAGEGAAVQYAHRVAHLRRHPHGAQPALGVVVEGADMVLVWVDS